MIGTFHLKNGTWIARKDRTYCPKCGKRVSATSHSNGIPNCENTKCPLVSGAHARLQAAGAEQTPAYLLAMGENDHQLEADLETGEIL